MLFLYISHTNAIMAIMYVQNILNTSKKLVVVICIDDAPNGVEMSLMLDVIYIICCYKILDREPSYMSTRSRIRGADKITTLCIHGLF